MGETPQRYVDRDDLLSCRPVYVVWEITLKCDLKCRHCGSRAGPARAQELSTAECIDLIRQLAALGTREVTIIGGEAYLRSDWIELVRAITDHGMRCSMTTGGRNLTEERVRDAAKAGLQSASVSVDGLEATHDRIRGVKGSWAAALDALRRLKDHGITVGSNSQISRLSMHELPQMMENLISAGGKYWQLQLTVAMGNAVENDGLLLQPYHLLELMPMLAQMDASAQPRGLTLVPGNNIGYFGPHEHLWRGGASGNEHWIGCNAGQNTMGIEADGTIKGCPSLPTKSYTGGNIRELTLEQIWTTAPEIGFTRDRTLNDLWGYCKGCYYADICRGGCSWTAHSLFGKPGNNPFCHHRALELAKQGKRERIKKVLGAAGESFDHGLFELLVEPLDSPLTDPPPVLPEPAITHHPSAE
jgi:radical SAM protein with 4Fe4S-binding SPASM domain